MNQNNQSGGIKFIRRGGRIIPISPKKEAGVAKEIVSNKKNRSSLGLLAGSTVGAMGSLYAAGRLQHFSKAQEVAKNFSFASKTLKVGKILKFGGSAIMGLAAGHALTSIDRNTNDERSKVMNIGKAASSPLGIAAQLGLAYGAYRFGKRFESVGKQGLSLAKKANWKELLKSVKDL